MAAASLQLKRAFAVPLQAVPLLFIAVFSALIALALQAGIAGLWLGLVLMAGFFRYSFVVLDELVMGRTSLPVFAIEMLNPIGEQRAILCMVFMVAVFFGSDAATYWFGPVFSRLVGLIAASIVPAVVAIQGATGSAAQSMNPVRWWRLAARLGYDYLWIVVAFGGALTLVMLGGSWSLPRVLRIALYMYIWFVLLAMVGGVLHERRDDLAMEDIYEPEMPDADGSAALERSRKQVLDLIYAEWRGGSFRNAWQTFNAHLERSDDESVELEWFYDRARNWPDPRFANGIAHLLLPKLLIARRTGEALDMTRDRLRATPDFRPLASADLMRLTELARAAGDRATHRLLQAGSAESHEDRPGL